MALLAALTLAPAVLIVLRRAIFWPLRSPRKAAGTDASLEESNTGAFTGFWAGIADLVVTYPLLILSVCLLVLAPLAVVGARTKANHNQLSDLDQDRPSVVGANVVRRYFAVGELSPAVVLLDNPRLDFRSTDGRKAIAEISRRLQSIKNIADVRSLTQPTGNSTRDVSDGGLLKRLAGQGAERRGGVAVCQHHAGTGRGPQPHYSL